MPRKTHHKTPITSYIALLLLRHKQGNAMDLSGEHIVFSIGPETNLIVSTCQDRLLYELEFWL